MTEINQQFISERTGFDNGAKFETDEQVRDYFRVETLRDCVGDLDVYKDLPTQTELDQMCQAVLDNGWHMDAPTMSTTKDTITFYPDPWDPDYEDDDDRADRLASLYDAGKVAVWWQDGCLHFQFRDRKTFYRGSAIEGCGIADDFVQHLAREFRDRKDG